MPNKSLKKNIQRFAIFAFFILAIQTPQQAFAKKAAKNNKKKIDTILVNTNRGELWVRKKSELLFYQIESKKTYKLPMGATISIRNSYLDSNPKTVLALNKKKKITISGELILKLTPDIFSSPNFLHQTLTEASLELPKTAPNFEKTMLRTLVHNSFSTSPDTGEKDQKKQDPEKRIIPFYPEIISQFSTSTFPYTVEFSWPAKGAQVEPHLLYINNRQIDESLVPYAYFEQGLGKVDFTEYGTYVWMITDKTGVYQSTPRTLKILPPENRKITVNIGDQKLLYDLIEIQNPTDNSTLTSCSNDRKITIPVILDTSNTKANYFALEHESNHKPIFHTDIDGEDSGRLYGSITVRENSNAKIRFRGELKENGEYQILAYSQWITLQIQRICTANQKSRYMNQFLDPKNTFDDQGTINLDLK